MSAHAAAVKPSGLARLAQLIGLATMLGVAYASSRFASHQIDPSAATIAAIGLLVIGGLLLSELLEPLGLPHLSGYLAVGVLVGPHVLHLVDHHTVERLSPVNTLALALIALAGGAELKTSLLRSTARSVGFATLAQSLVVFTLMTGVFLACSRYLPFTKALGFKALIGLAMLWAVLSVSRSPSACLGILAQTQAKGPLARFSLTFIMASDVVVVVMLAGVLLIARPLIIPGAEFSLDSLSALGHEILGSVSLGTTLGLILAAYLRLVNKQLLIVLLLLGFVFTEGLRYIHLDPLLTFISAGFVVENFSQQGEKLLHGVERTGSVVFVLFFATAGAHLDLPLLASLWPVAVTLALGRAVSTWLASRVGARWAGDTGVVRRWGWSGLVSQAGLTLGLAVVIQRAFPEAGAGFAALVVATVAINEVCGPILFKLALDRAGESGGGPPDHHSKPNEISP
ncbi:MAG: cation:proton antiporter [Polyangiaceae bacterium]